jgi:hypothetical protein
MRFLLFIPVITDAFALGNPAKHQLFDVHVVVEYNPDRDGCVPDAFDRLIAADEPP